MKLSQKEAALQVADRLAGEPSERSEAALLAAAYVLFLGFTFHGPARWAGNQVECGFFVDHFTFLAGPFFAAVHGLGGFLAMKLGYVSRA
jgi:putative oxidoreductase